MSHLYLSWGVTGLFCDTSNTALGDTILVGNVKQFLTLSVHVRDALFLVVQQVRREAGRRKAYVMLSQRSAH
jgi:hypothetical protein